LQPQCEALRTCRSGFPIATVAPLKIGSLSFSWRWSDFVIEPSMSAYSVFAVAKQNRHSHSKEFREIVAPRSTSLQAAPLIISQGGGEATHWLL